ncbi:MAG: cupin domain-containing protein [Calditrichaceae bacterium]|nr:cupin domain-containing protein [Calditrichaceae bacterium]HES60284.1 cupin domain-containing protein [Caldithrix sp.]
MKTHIKSSDFKTKEMFPGVTRQIIGHDSNLMLVKVSFTKGSIGYKHQHAHQQVSYILSGKFEVNIAGNIEILHAGDAFIAPTNADHEVKCLEDGIIIDSFSPMREDFL